MIRVIASTHLKSLMNIQTGKPKHLNNSIELNTFKIPGSSISRRIIPLSKLYSEHHFCLLFNWKIKEGIKNKITRQRIYKYIEYFWQNQLRHNFYNEEHFLFSSLSDACIIKAVDQHTEIRGLITEIATSKKTSEKKLVKLVTAIRLNIEYEEMALFPYFKQALSKIDLKNIGQHITEAHNSLEPDRYEDTFWISKK